MNGYIQKVAVLLIGIILFFLVPTSLLAQGNVSLSEAVNNNQVDVKISGLSSSYFQPMVLMEMRNLSGQPIEIDLPLGSRLENEQGSACELVVLRSEISPIYLEVLASDSPPVVYRLFTYCLDLEGQNNISYPSSEATYRPTGEVVSDDIMAVLQNIAQASAAEQEDFAAQIAIWSAATNYDLAQLQGMQGANYSFYTQQVEHFLGLDQVPPTPAPTVDATVTLLAQEQATADAQVIAQTEPQATTEPEPESVPVPEPEPEGGLTTQQLVFALLVGGVIVAGFASFAFMARSPQRPIVQTQSARSKNENANRKSDAQHDTRQKNKRTYSPKDLCFDCDQPLDANRRCTNKACSAHMPKKATVKTVVDERTDPNPVEDEPFGQASTKRSNHHGSSSSAPKPFKKVTDTEPLNQNKSKGYHEPTDQKEVEDNLSIKLEVISGDQKGKAYEISGNDQDLQAIISRGEVEQIALNDAKISMPHAVLDVWPENPTGDRIRDLGSKNGTLVNGQKISETKWHTLKEGDRLQFGTTKLRYDQAKRQLSNEEKPSETISLIGSTNRWLITRYKIKLIDFDSNDTKISVPHVCIRLRQGLLELRDISSNHAVNIGGKAVERWSYLFDKDVIQIGQRTRIKVMTDISGIPQVIGEWRRQRLIKHGGMAGIYRVEHINSGQPAVLKIPRPSKYRKENELGRKYQRLFAQECRLTSQIRDTNLVEEIDHGVIQNGVQLPYLVLNYIDGYSVDSMIEKLGVFSVPNAAEVVFWVGKALQALHKERYIHCDVKPSNIMIDRDGKVHLIDLGVATPIGQAFSGLGRREYLPEEIYSNHEPVDVDTDIYSLGQTLFRMLTESVPSGRLVADQDKNHWNRATAPFSTDGVPLPLPTLLRQKVTSRDMQTVIVHCINETRESRYPDMDALLYDLEPLRLRANLRALVQLM